MGRLIDADVLKKDLTRFYDGEVVARKLIDEQPTVDAVEVVHGRWKEDPSGYGFWICSACGFVSEASAANVLYKFCPHCGAKMDGKDDDYGKAD